MMTLIRGSDSAPSLLGESGVEITYRDLAERVRRFAGPLGDTCSLVVIVPENCVEAVVAYLACFSHGHGVMLIPPGQPEFLAKIEALYSPNWMFTRIDDKWRLQSRRNEPVALHPDLAVLLSTSGTRGAIKFVRLSHDNVVSNADSIRKYLNIASSDRAMLSLPFHCSYGLSVLNSHLLAGASLILTERSVTETPFWELFNREAATSLAGVPHTFERLDLICFDQLSLPSQKILIQAGGRFARDKVSRCARLAEKRHCRFFVVYGQTEAALRIASGPPQLLLENPDCIGVAILDGWPVGVDEQEGEPVYDGPNVMLGYATGPRRSEHWTLH